MKTNVRLRQDTFATAVSRPLFFGVVRRQDRRRESIASHVNFFLSFVHVHAGNSLDFYVYIFYEGVRLPAVVL